MAAIVISILIGFALGVLFASFMTTSRKGIGDVVLPVLQKHFYRHDTHYLRRVSEEIADEILNDIKL